MMEITKQLNQANISKQLQIKINKQLEFQFFHQLQENSSVKEILQSLSLNLQCQYKIDVFGKFIKNLQVFNTVFSEEFLQEITLSVEEKSFMPEEIIFTKDSESNYIYLILNGESIVLKLQVSEFVFIFFVKKVELNMIEAQGKQENFRGNTQIYKKGDILGYEEFISGKKRKNYATAKTISNAGCIEQKQFLEIIKKFPKDHEIFCMMKDKLVMYRERNQLIQRFKCMSCKQTTHDTQFCPLVKYIPNEKFLILKAQYSKNQERGICDRRVLKQKAYCQIHQVRSLVSQLQSESELQYRFQQEFNSQTEVKKYESLQEALKELDERNQEYINIRNSNNHILSSRDILQQEDQFKTLQFQKKTNKSMNSQQENQKQNFKRNSIQYKSNDTIDDSCVVQYYQSEKQIVFQPPVSDFNDKEVNKVNQFNQEAQNLVNGSLAIIEESPKQQNIQHSTYTSSDHENPKSLIIKNVKNSSIQSIGKIYNRNISIEQRKGMSNDQILSSHLISDDQNRTDKNEYTPQNDEYNIMKKVSFQAHLLFNNPNIKSREIKEERSQASRQEVENEVFIGFDTYKNFVYYFPHNNLEKILNLINKMKTKRKFKKIINKKVVKN